MLEISPSIHYDTSVFQRYHFTVQLRYPYQVELNFDN